jgi:hypothetical protein
VFNLEDDMKFALVFASATVAATMVFGSIAAQAETSAIHINTQEYKCRELKEIVAREGVIQVQGQWGPELVYSGQNSCDAFTWPTYTWVRTADKRHCGAGYVCREVHHAFAE